MHMTENFKADIKLSRHRMFIEESTEKLISRIRDTTTTLISLWDEVNMDQPSREARIECAYSHFYTLLDNIIASEKEVVDNVRLDIETRMQAIVSLRETFKMPPFNASIFPVNSIALLKALDKDLTALKMRKEKIIESQMTLYKEYKALCVQTNTLINEIQDIDEKIVDDKTLDEIRLKCADLQNVLEENLTKICSVQEECKKIQDVLSHHCNITRAEVLMLNTDFTAPNAIVSLDIIEKFLNLEQKLKDQYDEWIEQVAFRYDELLIKMADIAKKCGTANNAHLNYPVGFDPKLLAERDVQKMENDLKVMEEKYERGKPVFDKLNEWMGFWREKLDAERRVCRTSFYKNRGGALTASLKRQKQVCQQVPKVFAELSEAVALYVKNYDLSDILIEGMLPDKYAEYIMEEYQHDKEMQKSQKQFTKKTVRGKENATGSKIMMKSIFKTSQDASPAPSYVTANTFSTRKRSFSCSQISLISPTKPPLPIGHPIHSSPKCRRLSPVSSNCSTEAKTPRPVTPGKFGSSGFKSTSGRKLQANSTTTRAFTPSRPWY